MQERESRKERLERLSKAREMFKDLEEDSLFRTTALIEAISNGDHEEVRRLLDSGVDVNESGTGFMKTSPLITAVQLAGMPPEAHAMLRMAAGKLPDLSSALTDKAKGIFQDLDAKPAEAMKKIAGMLPSAFEFRAQLTERQDRRRKDVDDGAIPESDPLREEDADLIRLLIARGANLEDRDESGQTALAHAASAGQLESVRLLHDAGALIEAEDNGGRTPLMFAAHECKPETMRLLLHRGANVHARSRNGGTAIMSAASGGSRRALQVLLDAGADVNARSDDSSTALLIAAMLGFTDVVEQLRSAGAEIGFLEALALGDEERIAALMPDPGSQQPEWGRGLLTGSARAGRSDILRLLHRCGTSPDSTDGRGQSPLFRAVMSGDLNTVRALLDSGANPNPPRREPVSMTPLDWAVSTGTPDMVRLLIERGAEVNAVDPHGHTPLRHAAMKGNLEATRILLRAGADPNQAGDESSISPLGFAASMHNTEMVRLLLEHGANPSWSASKDIPADVLPGVKENTELLGLLHAADGTDLNDAAKEGDLATITSLLDDGRNIEQQDRIQHTPLHVAVEAGQTDAARLLLNRGANPSSESMFRITPLLLAVNEGNVEAVRLLLQAGGDPNVVMEAGTTPVIAAARHKDESLRPVLVELLVDHGAKIRLQEAAALGDVGTVRSLLDMGISPDDANTGGTTALMTAAGGGHLPIVEVLLQRSATVDLADLRGLTALTWAMTGVHLNVARLLLESGADANGPSDPEGEFDLFRTPLQAAVSSGSVEAVAFLLDSGAALSGEGARGKCALHTAAMLPDDKVAMLELLLERGADPNALDDHDLTPLATAAIIGRVEIARTLLAHGADPSVRALGGQTALQYAKHGGHQEIIDLLEHAAAKSKPES